VPVSTSGSPPEARDVAVVLEDLRVRYGDVEAVAGVNLEIVRGETFALLGPSGCGKTTTLMAITGFAPVASGRILVNGRDVTNLPPWKRQIGVVFQDYALFPNRTARGNVEYGLRVQKVARDERRSRVQEMLDLTELAPHANRHPSQLSGGQQQRVAVGRALAVRPNLLLLDEPLSNLDATLRASMLQELRRLQASSGVTTVYVTHDREEAFGLADWIGVMRAGRLEQVGKPRELYERPASRFVASFLGPANFIDGEIVPNGDGSNSLLTEAGRWPLPDGTSASAGSRVWAMIRPERVGLSTEADIADRAIAVGGRIDALLYRGSEVLATVETGLGPIQCALSARETERLALQQPVRLTLDADDLVLLSRETSDR
jgi:putative spermidine/putrescine transport system ATP-binding protein